MSEKSRNFLSRTLQNLKRITRKFKPYKKQQTADGASDLQEEPYLKNDDSSVKNVTENLLSEKEKTLILEPVESNICLNTIINNDNEVHLIHINDFYEIFNDYCNFSNLENHIMKLKEKINNVALIIAGDVLSPSPMTKWKLTDDIKNKIQEKYNYEIISESGKLGNGFHIIHLLCELGKFCKIPIFATLGNHEFDVPVQDLLLRLKESFTKEPEDEKNFGKICYIVSNIDKYDKSYQDKFEEYTLSRYTYKKLNLIGIVGGMSFLKKLKSNDKNKEIIWDNVYSEFFDNTDNLNKLAAFINFDNVIAITHLNQPEDVCIWTGLKNKKKDLKLIMGGHEHFSTVTHDANLLGYKIYKGDGDLYSFHHHIFAENNLIKSYKILNPVFDEIKIRTLEHKNIYDVQQFYQELYFENNPEEKVILGNIKKPLSLIEQDLRGANGHEAAMLWCDEMKNMMEEKILADMKIAVCLIGGSIRYDGVIQINQTFRNYDIKKIVPFKNNIVLIKLDYPIFIDYLKCHNDNAVATGKSGSFYQYKLYNIDDKKDKRITHIITHENPKGSLWGGENFIRMPFGNNNSTVIHRITDGLQDSFIKTVKTNYIVQIPSSPLTPLVASHQITNNGGKKKINKKNIIKKKNKTYKKKRPIKRSRAGKSYRAR